MWRFQCSVQPLAKKEASLIGKETLALCYKSMFSYWYQKANIEGRHSIDFKLKRQSTAIPSFEILRFDIRYSAVRCFSPAAKADSLIIMKPCHLGEVSYEVSEYSDLLS